MDAILEYIPETLLQTLVTIAVVVGVTLGVISYLILLERKLSAWMQDRRGPNRVGPMGIFQPLADGVKFFTKEDFMPNAAERWLFILAPASFMFVACMTSAVIPWGTELTLFGKPVSLQLTDLNIGVLYILGFTSLGVYGIMIGGWASNKFGYRPPPWFFDLGEPVSVIKPSSTL